MSAVADPSVARVTPEMIAGFIKEPLTMLPELFRLPVWDFWAFFSEPLASQFALCSRIRCWIRDDGLDVIELSAAFKALRSIDNDTSLKFATDVLDGLRDTIRDNRKRERDKERNRRSAEAVTVTGHKPVAAGLAERFAVPPSENGK